MLFIDNSDTIEFDDAFSLWNETKADGKEYQTLSVYISNVSFWMEELDLWNAFHSALQQFICLIRNAQCYQQF